MTVPTFRAYEIGRNVRSVCLQDVATHAIPSCGSR